FSMKSIVKLTSLGLLLSLACWGQATAGLGGISGTVLDASGAPVPGAKVVVSNPSLGVKRDLVTTRAGDFAAPALTPEKGYQVEVNKDGFAPYQVANLQLQVGQVMNLHIALVVGAISQKVDITAEAPAVDDVKTETSEVVGNTLIDNLPINGRRVDSFVLLTPAVTKDADFGLLTFRGMAGGNSFLVDGVDTTNQYYNENAGRTRLGSQLSQDAVQEFQVLNSNYAAEFGRASGGVVNTITKSGTNDIHGSFFWFFRNRTLDARDRYAAINPPEVRHQTGGTIGGPIKKDKLFYFFDTEIQRRHDPMVDSIFGNANVNSSSQTWIGCAAPATAAQCTAINSLLPRMFGLTDRRADQQLYFAKIDYHLNDRNTFSVSLNYLKFFSPNGIQTGVSSTSGAAVGTNGDDSVRDRIGKLSWTAVPSSSVVNEFRFGWFKDRQADDYDPTLFKGYPIGQVSLSVAGVSTLGGYNVLPRVNPSENRFQFADTLAWVKGSHTFKFGADVSSTEDYANSLSNRFGSYTYSNVTTFAQDFTSPLAGPSHYSSFTQVFGNPIVDTTVKDFGFFAQDSWKITPRLTANYGVRYEYAMLPQPSITNPNYPQTGHINSPTGDLAPRIGFAYHLNDKTAIRAGYGLFYARFETGLINTLFANNGVYTQSLTFNSPTAAGAPIFPNVLSGSSAATGASSITFAAPDLRNPYTQQINVAVERSLSSSMTLTVSYVQNRGKRLYTVRDLNIGPLSSQYYTFTILNSSYQPTGQTYNTQIYLPGNRVDSRYQHVYQVENGGKQWYDAGVVQLVKRFSNTFQGTVSYTWSHELDENQESGSNAIYFSSGPMGLYNGNYSYDKGNGNLDQRHRFVGTFVARPKLMKSDGKFARYIANGWELTGLLTLASGRPNYEYVSFSSTANLPQAFTGSLDGLGGDNRVPWLQNNPLQLDPTYRFDTRLQKKIPIGDKMSLSLLFEVFNLTNTVANTSVSAQGFTAANKGTAAAPQFVVAPCASATATTCSPTTPGLGTASGGFPDGTNARRAQVGLRFAF
ncbi:MAG TPA: carboxypeptidase regulatory-like domain-containing protein, partial [Bryobacteraceae bacterium]